MIWFKFFLIQLLSLILMLLGWVILIPICLFLIRANHLPRLFWIWDNQEDGVLPSWYRQKNAKWSEARCVFNWTARRNSCNNLRFVKGFSQPKGPYKLWTWSQWVPKTYFLRYIPIKWDKSRSAKLDLPDTVRGVLQARLDGLVPTHKELLKMASVIGRVFWTGALREVLPAELSTDDLATSLDSLRARELIKPQPSSSVSGEREYSFATQALCDAAYELVPRAQSIAAHRRVAEWLSARGELWEGGHANLAAHLEASKVRPARIVLCPGDAASRGPPSP